jgi:uncharacterized pyridoxamine 5'-phosphate oxidase family protein
MYRKKSTSSASIPLTNLPTAVFFCTATNKQCNRNLKEQTFLLVSIMQFPQLALITLAANITRLLKTEVALFQKTPYLLHIYGFRQ